MNSITATWRYGRAGAWMIIRLKPYQTKMDALTTLAANWLVRDSSTYVPPTNSDDLCPLFCLNPSSIWSRETYRRKSTPIKIYFRHIHTYTVTKYLHNQVDNVSKIHPSLTLIHFPDPTLVRIIFYSKTYLVTVIEETFK